MGKKTVISLFDYTGIMVAPWVNNGYQAIIADIQHDKGIAQKSKNLYTFGGDLRNGIPNSLLSICDNVEIVFSFFPCTHTAVSGAAHFLKKGPRALAQSLDFFATGKELGEKLGTPYAMENPVSTISTYCGPSQYSFNPFEYGGYLPINDIHPEYPEYIMPRDAYPKKTHIWCGNGFVMPPKKPVDVGNGYSLQHKKLGGKSLKTKNIRSATPRGFAKAVYLYNSGKMSISDYAEKKLMQTRIF